MPEMSFQSARDLLRAGVLNAAGHVPSPPVPSALPEPDPLPPGVLGYVVGVFPGGDSRCKGLTHADLMTREAAAREAAGYARQARNDIAGAWHGGSEYRVLEIREANGDA